MANHRVMTTLQQHMGCASVILCFDIFYKISSNLGQQKEFSIRKVGGSLVIESSGESIIGMTVQKVDKF